ncbi:MAG: LysM peptidoglycan-binding domain-containing protein [Pirellulales bacterium]
MNTLKNAAVIALLVGVGYGVYVVVNRGADPPPPGVDTAIPKLEVGSGVETGIPPTGAPPSNPSVSYPLSPSTALPPARSHQPVPPALGHRADATERDRSGYLDPPPLVGTSRPPDDTIPDARRVDPALAQRGADAPVDRRIPTEPLASKGAPAASPPARASDQPPKGTFADAWRDAQDLLAAQKLVEAHANLSIWYADARLTRAEDEKLTELLGQLAGTIIYSSRDHLLEKPYVVKPSDSLDAIAMAHFVTPKLLAKINGLDDPKSIQPGDTLKVVRGPFHAVVHISREEISLQLAKRYAGRFRIVRTGNDFRLPQKAAIYSVSQKANANGEHWIGLEGGYAIHADISPGATGSAPQPGRDSIAINAKDAEDLFDILTVDPNEGSKVGIVPPDPGLR